MRQSLGGIAIGAALERAEVAPEQVQHVVMGQVLQAGQGQIPSRQAQIKAGIPKEVSSETINKVCASGVRAVGMLDAAIRAGDLEVARRAAGWSRCRAPRICSRTRASACRMGDGKALDAMVHDGLTNPFTRQADVRRGDRGRRRARADPPRPRSLGAALAPACDQGDRRGACWPRRSWRSRSQRRKGDTVVEIDEAPRRGHHARGAREAARPGRQGGLAHRRQLAGRQRRRRRAGAGQRRVGFSQ